MSAIQAAGLGDGVFFYSTAAVARGKVILSAGSRSRSSNSPSVKGMIVARHAVAIAAAVALGCGLPHVAWADPAACAIGDATFSVAARSYWSIQGACADGASLFGNGYVSVDSSGDNWCARARGTGTLQIGGQSRDVAWTWAFGTGLPGPQPYSVVYWSLPLQIPLPNDPLARPYGATFVMPPSCPLMPEASVHLTGVLAIVA
ncbi:MAG: hypothetical protein ACRDJM_05875 [Actinomycetota bacterium]